jgi:nucleoside-diphosphate-sugar epimerase
MGTSLVTGGAGFIGSNMVRFLLKQGERVRVLDNFETGKHENLAEIIKQIELIEGDVRDTAAVNRATKGCDVVYHLAALGSVPRSIKDPATTNAVNVDGTFNVLMGCRDGGIRRVVFASSSSVYGDNKELPQHEKLPVSPISPYAASKAIGEVYCQTFWRTYGLQSACLRYFNVFGPRQDPTSQYAAAIPLFVSSLLHDRRPGIFDDGEQSRGFTYIDNVLEANWKAANAPEVHGEAVNISTATSVTVNTVVQAIQQLLGKEHIKPEYKPPRPGDIKHSLADVSRAAAVIGYTPKISFEEGIRLAIDWYKANLA